MGRRDGLLRRGVCCSSCQDFIDLIGTDAEGATGRATGRDHREGLPNRKNRMKRMYDHLRRSHK